MAPFFGHHWFSYIKTTYFGDENGPRSEFSSILSLMVVRLEIEINYTDTVLGVGAIRIIAAQHNNKKQEGA